MRTEEGPPRIITIGQVPDQGKVETESRNYGTDSIRNCAHKWEDRTEYLRGIGMSIEEGVRVQICTVCPEMLTEWPKRHPNAKK